MAYINLVIFGLFLLSLGLSYGNQHWGSPVCSVFIRWNRWILFSLVAGVIAKQFEFTDRPYWLVSVCAFFGWFLAETAYNWIAIGVLSKSSVPLFPSFEKNNEGERWPSSKRFLKLKESIRNEGFSRACALRAKLGEGAYIYSSIYEDIERKIRLQLLFVPVKPTVISVCCAFSSVNEKGERIITDNIFLPFGGYYPDSWYLVRKPSIRSFKTLLCLHCKRMELARFDSIPWGEQSPLEDLKEQYQLLQKTNTERGFLSPLNVKDQFGRITSEGRYRIWKEVWLLSYFGISVHY